MLRPSTAPRWKRQTRIGRSDGLAAGRAAAYAARARNSGSSPRLTNANPPAFTNTRLLMDTSSLSFRPSGRQAVRPSLLLKVRTPERQPHSHGAGLHGITDVHDLLQDDVACVRRH